MSCFILGGMERVFSQINSGKLINIFKISLLPTLDQVAGQSGPSSANTVIIQLGNDPKRKFTRTKSWLSRKGKVSINWPS